jgi:DNA-dependent RNA polymerase auxiliary subunit epsilon
MIFNVLYVSSWKRVTNKEITNTRFLCFKEFYQQKSGKNRYKEK